MRHVARTGFATCAAPPHVPSTCIAVPRRLSYSSCRKVSTSQVWTKHVTPYHTKMVPSRPRPLVTNNNSYPLAFVQWCRGTPVTDRATTPLSPTHPRFVARMPRPISRCSLVDISANGSSARAPPDAHVELIIKKTVEGEESALTHRIVGKDEPHRRTWRYLNQYHCRCKW